MNTSEAIDQIVTALAKAQGEIKNPAKDSKNPHFNSAYADLAGGLNAVRAALSSNGIAVLQATSMDGEIMMLETKLAHTSGQWVSSHYPVCRFPVKHQEAGSALTYSRRYSLFALVGIAGDDDDGNEASKSETPAPARKAVAAPASEPVDPEESKQAREFIVQTMDVCETPADFDQWAKENKAQIGKLTTADQALVRSAFQMRKHNAIEAQKDAA